MVRSKAPIRDFTIANRDDVVINSTPLVLQALAHFMKNRMVTLVVAPVVERRLPAHRAQSSGASDVSI